MLWWVAEFLGAWARAGGPAALVVDSGANVGQESILSASLGHRVVAFEPFFDTLDTARLNARTNCVRGRAEDKN